MLAISLSGLFFEILTGAALIGLFCSLIFTIIRFAYRYRYILIGLAIAFGIMTIIVYIMSKIGFL